MGTRRNHIDLVTLIAVLTLMVLSLGIVYSASSTWAMQKFGDSGRLLGSHATKVLAGFLVIFVMMNLDYKKYKKLTKPVLLGAVALLMVTLALGGEVKGASRWLRLGGFGLQPSEFAKYALIFHLCAMISVKKALVRDFKTGYVPMLIWIGLVTVLVLLQPNFSNGAMIFAVSLVMLWVGGARVSHMALTFGSLVPLLVVYMLSAPYRVARLVNFLGG